MKTGLGIVYYILSRTNRFGISWLANIIPYIRRELQGALSTAGFYKAHKTSAYHNNAIMLVLHRFHNMGIYMAKNNQN